MNLMSKNKTTIVLFLEGFVSVSLQIFIMRQLVPFSGNDVEVTSFIVGIFLAALSLGYWKGGQHSSNHLEILSKNLIISAIIITIGFSYNILHSYFTYTDQFIDNELFQLTIYLLIFMFPVIYLLGQTIPILTNFVKSNSVSEITGRALALNTVGSVFGSIGTSLILFHYIGVSATLFFNVLLVFIIVNLVNLKSNFILNNTVGVVILVICFKLNINYEKNNFLLTNTYANYELETSTNNGVLTEFFKINNSYSSGLYDRTYSFEYAHLIASMIERLNIENKHILVLGAGGFTLSEVEKNNKYTYIDIDPDIKDVAEEHFLRKEINGEFIAQDARQFVKNTELEFDHIIIDLFSNEENIPWHLKTKEFFDLVNDKLNSDSYVIINTIIKKGFKDDYSKTFHNTINNSFGYCYVMPIMFKKQDNMNVEYFCTKKEEKESPKIFIDDRTYRR